MIQATIKKKLSFVGLGVHNAQLASLSITPAQEDAGISFIHKNFSNEPIHIGLTVPLEAMHATVLRQKSWTLSTVEHLMAALRIFGVDNALITLDGGNEVPILDGSAAPFFHGLYRAGLLRQGLRKKFLTPKQPILLEEQAGKKILLNPLSNKDQYGGLYCDYKAFFNHYALGQKQFTGAIDQHLFKTLIAPARTFGFLKQLPVLRSHKLAMASSLGNTLVFNDDESINSSRIANEWLNHKILDFIGDLGLLPHTFTGHVEAAQTGHAFNRRIVEHYLAHKHLWEII